MPNSLWPVIGNYWLAGLVYLFVIFTQGFGFGFKDLIIVFHLFIFIFLICHQSSLFLLLPQTASFSSFYLFCFFFLDMKIMGLSWSVVDELIYMKMSDDG